MKLTVNVTQEDIAEADTRREYPRPENCPIALALRRQTGLPWWVLATAFLTRALGSRVSLPPEAMIFAMNFDLGQTPAPITFTLEVPDSLYEAHH